MRNVIKLGGELALEEEAPALQSLIESARRRLDLGERLVIVHGGGPQTSSLMAARGIPIRLVGGRRITDEAALGALLMAVGGEVNIRIVSAFQQAGIDAVGLNGVSHRCITCARLKPGPAMSAGGAWTDYGFVGEVERVDREFFELFLSRDMVPVVACIGCDSAGRPLNVNADAMAHGLAKALQADRLVFITGAPGVLRDPDDPDSRWTSLTAQEAQAAIASGAVRSGMIAKLEEAFRALEAGVSEIHILGRVSDGDLERALSAPGSVGTVLRA